MLVPLTLGCKFVVLPGCPKGSETFVALVALWPDTFVPQHACLVEGPAAVDAVNHSAETRHIEEVVCSRYMGMYIHTYVVHTVDGGCTLVRTYVYCMHVRTCGRCITHTNVATYVRTYSTYVHVTVRLTPYTSETRMGVSVG